MKNKMEYFDYLKGARKGDLEEKAIKLLEKQTKKKYPNDQMMFELKMLKAINSFRLLSNN